MKYIKKKISKLFGGNKSNLTKDLLSKEIEMYGFEIGDHSYGKPQALWGAGKTILEVGKFCSFGENVTIYLGGNHSSERITTYPFAIFRKNWNLKRGEYTEVPQSNGKVVIGSDVWIADEATILSGVTVGHGAIIANRAMVTKDVPPYAVVAGNPAKVVKKRFDDETIASLLETKWWDLSDEKIEQLIPLLLSEDIESFIAKCKELSE